MSDKISVDDILAEVDRRRDIQPGRRPLPSYGGDSATEILSGLTSAPAKADVTIVDVGVKPAHEHEEESATSILDTLIPTALLPKEKLTETIVKVTTAPLEELFRAAVPPETDELPPIEHDELSFIKPRPNLFGDRQPLHDEPNVVADEKRPKRPSELTPGTGVFQKPQKQIHRVKADDTAEPFGDTAAAAKKPKPRYSVADNNDSRNKTPKPSFTSTIAGFDSPTADNISVPVRKTENKGGNNITAQNDQTFVFPLFSRKNLSKQQQQTPPPKPEPHHVVHTDVMENNPDELIGAISASLPLPLPKEPKVDTAPFSGDTLGIVGDDLKEISAKAADEHFADLPTAESEPITAETDIKEYEPTADEPTPHKSYLSKKSNTALIENLNRSLKKRLADETATLNVRPPRSDSAHTAPLIPASEFDPSDGLPGVVDGAIETTSEMAEKALRSLNNKRKRKISDFIFDGGAETDDDEPFSRDDDSAVREDADEMRTMLRTQHAGLFWRLCVLVLLTLGTAAVTLFNDLGVNLAYRIAGTDIGTAFLNRRYDTFGYVMTNMLAVALGVVVCSGAVRDGLVRLFTGHADCDSMAAVAVILPVLSMVPALGNFDLVQRGVVGVYTTAALAALLFNTMGKFLATLRMKRCLSAVYTNRDRYFADLLDYDEADVFLKGTVSRAPLAVRRKAGVLTGFPDDCYKNDYMDGICRLLVPITIGAAALVGIASYFSPFLGGGETRNIVYALASFSAAISALCPLCVSLIANFPLHKANKALADEHSALLGYPAAAHFSEVGAIMVDAKNLFPEHGIVFHNFRKLKNPNSVAEYSPDEIFITAASLAKAGNSVMYEMFRDAINGDHESLLKPLDNVVYEVNMGLLGWLGRKRVLLGNREHMKHHGIKVVDRKKEQEFVSDNGDAVYLAIGGEAVALFHIEIGAEGRTTAEFAAIKSRLEQLDKLHVGLIVRTNDSVVTVNRLAELFDIDPERMRVLPFEAHARFEEATRYVPVGDGSLTTGGGFTSLARGVVSAKKIVDSIKKSVALLYVYMFAAFFLLFFCAFFGAAGVIGGTNILLINGGFLALVVLAQSLNNYN
ncbi:MAG: hypothetical protein LBN40_03315 [Oscillospiraceae bacterium]|jgi:Cu+-exporting ATPase|nr:hypothetical protein [Oscillospiraceae bacterium]